jgi:hypothetical protein
VTTDCNENNREVLACDWLNVSLMLPKKTPKE